MRDEPKTTLVNHNIGVPLDDAINDGLFEFAKI